MELSLDFTLDIYDYSVHKDSRFMYCYAEIIGPYLRIIVNKFLLEFASHCSAHLTLLSIFELNPAACFVPYEETLELWPLTKGRNKFGL